MARRLAVWLAFVAVCFTAALSGLIWPPGAWYASLAKPAWTPPNQVFGPVWTTLYVLMGSAAWLVWRDAVRTGRSARRPLLVFALQLALNAAWTPVFFGAHRMLAALFVIVALWGAIIATIVVFGRRSRPAALLLVPYLLWVSLATALNFELWRLDS